MMIVSEHRKSPGRIRRQFQSDRPANCSACKWYRLARIAGRRLVEYGLAGSCARPEGICEKEKKV